MNSITEQKKNQNENEVEKESKAIELRESETETKTMELYENEENYLSQDILNIIFSYLIDIKNIEDIKSKESIIENLKLVNNEMYETTESFLNNNLEYKYRNEVQEILNDELEYTDEDEDRKRYPKTNHVLKKKNFGVPMNSITEQNEVEKKSNAKELCELETMEMYENEEIKNKNLIWLYNIIPIEIFQYKICKYLGQRELLRCRLVCGVFNEIVEKHPQIFKMHEEFIYKIIKKRKHYSKMIPFKNIEIYIRDTNKYERCKEIKYLKGIKLKGIKEMEDEKEEMKNKNEIILFEILPKDVYKYEIFKYLGQKELLSCRLVCGVFNEMVKIQPQIIKLHEDFVYKIIKEKRHYSEIIPFKNIEIHVRSIYNYEEGEAIKYLKGIHTLKISKFININITTEMMKEIEGTNTIIIEKCGISDEGMKYLKGIKKLDIINSDNITDKGLKYIEGVEELNIKKCRQITGEGLKHLKGIKKLDMSESEGLTNENMKYMEGIEEINVSRCKQITDEGIKYLKGVRKLNVSKCEKITDEGISELKGIEELNISNCYEITDEGISKLKGIKYLNVSTNQNITDAGLKNLQGIKILNISSCLNITSAGLKYLKGIHTLIMSDCPNITGVGFENLKGIHTLYIDGCDRMTNRGFDKLKGIKKLNINGCNRITNKAFESLQGIETLKMVNCYKITNGALVNLRGIKTLDISYCKQITNNGIYNLKGIKKLIMKGCDKITNDGVKVLKGIETIDIRKCYKIKSKIIKDLKDKNELEIIIGRDDNDKFIDERLYEQYEIIKYYMNTKKNIIKVNDIKVNKICRK